MISLSGIGELRCLELIRICLSGVFEFCLSCAVDHSVFDMDVE